MKEHSMRAARAEATTTSPTLTAGPRSPHRSALGLLVLVLGVLAQALVAPAPARAFRCLRFGCPAWCGPVPMTLTSLSADLEAIAAGTTRSTVDQAFTDWTRVSCTSLEVSVTESLSGGIPFFGDGASHVGFVETDWPFDPNAIGISDVQVMGGCITEADTLLNGQNFTWVLGAGDAGLVNAYGALLHESGHLYGLGHSQEARSVMWFLYRGGRPILEQDDFDGICDLYPRAGAPADCAVTGCPLGWACEASVCEPLGTAGCIRHEDCEDDERCDAVTGACVVGVPTGDVLGAPCVDDLDCLSGLCAQLTTGGVCTEACDGLAPRAVACPTGFLCDGDAVGVCGTGLCLAGRPGDASLGAPCEEDSDCASSMCDDAVCATPCDPLIEGGCPNGFVCEPGQAAGCGACKPPLQLGARCRFNEDCADGYCITNEGAETGACATECDPAAGRDACPDGFRCEAMGELALCVADPIGRPSLSGGSCSVSVADERPSLAGLAVLGLLALVGRRARRRSGFSCPGPSASAPRA